MRTSRDDVDSLLASDGLEGEERSEPVVQRVIARRVEQAVLELGKSGRCDLHDVRVDKMGVNGGCCCVVSVGGSAWIEEDEREEGEGGEVAASAKL